MTIYTSTKVLPYVYMGIHRETGQFYIGSRITKYLKLPPEQDLIKYRTSSKIVKPIFDEFDWTIIAMFFDSYDAYIFEQELIYENWDNPLKLNKSCKKDSKILFSKCGVPVSDETKMKLHLKNIGKIIPPEIRKKISDSIAGELHPNYGKNLSKETKRKISEANSGSNSALYGLPRSEKTKQKISEANSGKNHYAYGKSLSDIHRDNLSKNWKLIGIDGTEYYIRNLCEFCRSHKLDASALIRVADGKQEYHKGWKCIRLP